MTELEHLQLRIERYYAARPVFDLSPLFVGGRDYARFDAWSTRLNTLKLELVDLCEGRIACAHPTGARLTNPITGKTHCDLCGKELK
jgi:hypothetical protein